MFSQKKSAVVSLVLAAILLVGCNSSSGVSDTDSSDTDSSDTSTQTDEKNCGNWTRENPAPQSEVLECGDWKVSVSASVYLPDSVILAANSLNDTPPPGGATILVRLKATYNGSGVGDLSDVFGSGGGLVDLNGTRYADDSPCCKEDFDPWDFETEPYSGGTVEANLFFMTASRDKEYLLGFDLDSYDEVRAWMKINPGTQFEDALG